MSLPKINSTEGDLPLFNGLYNSTILGRMVECWGCEPALMFWLLGIQENNNKLEPSSYIIGKEERQRFIEHSDYKFKDITVKHALMGLEEKGILLSIKRSQYKFNPHFFWKGGKQSRVNQINKNNDKSK